MKRSDVAKTALLGLFSQQIMVLAGNELVLPAGRHIPRCTRTALGEAGGGDANPLVDTGILRVSPACPACPTAGQAGSPPCSMKSRSIFGSGWSLIAASNAWSRL